MQDTWDQRFIKLAQHFASWSKDPSTKVGAVIVNDERQVLGHGYNGFPRGVDDCPERYADRKQKYPRVVHAEMNAILNTGVPMALKGAWLYVTLFPCCECAKAVIQTGITKVFVPIQAANDRWSESHRFSEDMLREAGVELIQVLVD